MDDDVAAALERRRLDRGTRLRDEINELLRAGLAASSKPAEESAPYRLPTFDPGAALIGDQRALAELLDDEDIERGLPARS